MQDFQQRVVEEKHDLDGKIERLRAFIGSSTFRSLEVEDAWLIVAQLKWMEGYTLVLGRRIVKWGIE